MPRITKTPVALKTLKAAAAELKRHVAKADLNRDGKLSVAEASRYGRSIDNRAVGEALGTMASWAMLGDGAAPAVRAVPLRGVRDNIDAAVRVISAKDLDGNRRLDGSELTKAERLKTYQALAKVAESLDLHR